MEGVAPTCLCAWWQSSPFGKGWIMVKRLFVLGAVFMLFSVVLVAPVSAAKPLDVEFDLTTYFAPPPALPSGTFTAAGTAVDEGLMCHEGTTSNLAPEKWSGNSGVVTNGQVITEFMCTGGPFDGDTFVVKWQMHIEITEGPPTWVLTWVVKDATGGLAGLHGTGSGSGSLIFDGPPPPIGAHDVLAGHLH